MNDDVELHDPDRLAACIENIRQSLLLLPEFYNVCNSCAFIGGVAMTLLMSWEDSKKSKTFEEYVDKYLNKIKDECDRVYVVLNVLDKQTHETSGTQQ